MKPFIVLILAGFVPLSPLAYSQDQNKKTQKSEIIDRVDQQQLEANAPQWSDLQQEQQALLENLADQFDSLPAKRRTVLAKGSEQYLTLNTEQQKRLRAMVRKFRKMSASEKREKCRLYAKTHKQVPFFCEDFLVIK